MEERSVRWTGLRVGTAGTTAQRGSERRGRLVSVAIQLPRRQQEEVLKCSFLDVWHGILPVKLSEGSLEYCRPGFLYKMLLLGKWMPVGYQGAVHVWAIYCTLNAVERWNLAQRAPRRTGHDRSNETCGTLFEPGRLLSEDF